MSEWGFTNLHFAAMTGQCKVVELKLEQDKSKIKKENIKNDFGMLPLHYAAEMGHTYVFMALLEVSEDQNPKGEDGNTPLCLAAENVIQQNSTQSCNEWVKLCIDSSSCSPQTFQIHSVGAYKRDSGSKSMETLESEFTQALGGMAKYDPFMEVPDCSLWPAVVI